MSFQFTRLCRTLLFIAMLGPSMAWSSSGPNRVVALTWASAEDLLTLGITPLAIADAAGYRAWVGCPTLQKSVVDVGSRTEPNLELIASLKPDLIIIDSELNHIKGLLSKIAPVLFVAGYNYKLDAFDVALENFNFLSAELKLRSVAEDRKRTLTETLKANRALLAAEFKNELPDVTLVRFMSPYIAAIFTKHSAPVAAGRLLGLSSGYPLDAAPWGITQNPVTQLRKIDHGYVIHILPFFDSNKLFDSQVWSVMPFVQNGHFHSIQSTWTYGGLFSIYNLAHRLTEALLGKSASKDLTSSCDV